MENKLKEDLKLHLKAKAVCARNAELQQALAQLEANLSREENQKVTEKSQKS